MALTVIPLAAPVPADLSAQAVEWILNHTGLNAWRECMDLPATCRAAGLHFMPGRRPGGPAVERATAAGDILAVPLDALSQVKVPEPVLMPWQRAHLAKLGGGYSWAARFKATNGTPLDLRTLDAVRLLEALGCHLGKPRSWGAGTKYRTSCPWGGEHSHPDDSEDSVLFISPGRWPTWHCSHSHHLHLGLVDLLDAAGCLR